MTNKKLKLTEFAETSWKEYALYTLNDRALPSMVDGLKPSQRFIIYSALKNAKDKIIKVVEIAGPVSSYGYHHGEASVQKAAVGMASTWANNVPLLEGKGNFGSRLVQEASDARYIFAKIHKNFTNIFTDTELAPENPDEEIHTPKFYLPLIPTVLLNGVSGMATGYSTNILPYDIKDIIKLCKDYINNKNIDNRSLIPKYPQFNGDVVPNSKGGYDIVGKYSLVGKTKLVIEEIPYQYDRDSYVQILDALEDSNIILGYVDQCSKHGFKFTVNLKRDFTGNIEKIFKLRRSVKENLNVIDHLGKLKEYSSPIELIKDFCDMRIPYIQLRIDTTIDTLRKEISLINDKIKFITMVLDNKIKFKEKSKKDLRDDLISLNFHTDNIDPILSMHFYHLTKEEIEKLKSKNDELMEKMTYFRSTHAQNEYLIDLDKLAKEYK